jgi:hypothetical protein
MTKKKYYKVFRVCNGTLVSAYEAGRKQHTYHEGKVTTDYRPEGFKCPGLMLIEGFKEARHYFRECTARIGVVFTLYEVEPITEVRDFPDVPEFLRWGKLVDSLRVGRQIAIKRIGG